MTHFSVVHGNALEHPADLLLLKHATVHVGLDEVVSERLVSIGVCQLSETCPAPGEVATLPTNGILASKMVMFVGTPSLVDFAYEEMRSFAAQAIQWIGVRHLPVTTLATTVHGAGYGLDAGEAMQHLILGFRQGLMNHPECGIRRITFVERSEANFRLLQKALTPLGGDVELDVARYRSDDQDDDDVRLAWQTPLDERRTSPGTTGVMIASSEQGGANKPGKEHVFVAMPFTEEFEDVYEFGIYGPVRECGYICEKVDQSSFTGDILQRVRQRISTSKLVIADLSQARPNVYLEVGFAWGMNVPVVFLARQGEQLHFDVQSHRCIFYPSIRQLARELKKLLTNLDVS